MRNIFLFLFLIPVVGSAQIGDITTVAGNGVAGYTGDMHLATSAELDNPIYMNFDALGNLFIADAGNNVIRKLDVSGIITTVAGNGFGAGTSSGGYSGNSGAATDAELYSPTDIVIDASGNMFIADGGNNVIRKVNTSGIISTIAGTGTSGYSGNGGAAILADFSPYGLTIDNIGNIYFTDGNNPSIRKINTSGIITTIAGNGTVGNTGDNGPATAAKLHIPGGIAISASGNIYVTDWASHCVRKISAVGIITTIAGNGTAGNTGDGDMATSAELNAPNGVTVDDSENIYISDNYANVIRKVNPEGIITTVAGNGTEGFSGDDGLPTSAQMDRPNCVAFNPSGNMFIVDAFNNRIRKITYHPEAVNNILNVQNITSIYPTPAHNEVTIKTTDKIKSVDIINLIGQEIYNQSYSNVNSTDIAISSFASGVYFVKVNGVYAAKFLKE